MLIFTQNDTLVTPVPWDDTPILTMSDLDELQAGLLDTALAGVAIASFYYWRMTQAQSQADRWLIGKEYLGYIRRKIFGDFEIPNMM